MNIWACYAHNKTFGHTTHRIRLKFSKDYSVILTRSKEIGIPDGAEGWGNQKEKIDPWNLPM